MRTPVRALAVGALSLSILLSACGGWEERTTKEATATPTPGGQAIPIASLAELKSFRYTAEFRLDAPGVIFSRIEIEGSAVPPDKAAWRMTVGEGGNEVRVVIVGDRTWFFSDGVWAESPKMPRGPSASLLLPEKLSDAIIDEEAFRGREPKREQINGMETLHYSTTGAGLEFLALLTGSSEPGAEFDGDVKTNLWLTEDGGYPVRMVIDAGGTDTEGREISVQLEMNVTDLNDPGIEIEPPHS
jgi:hypothetical protein